MRVIGRFPLRVHYFNSVWLAYLVENVLRYRTDAVDRCLFFSFPGMSDEERLQIRHRFYRHFVRVNLELLWSGTGRSKKQVLDSGLLNISNPELLERMPEGCPSVMVMCAHTGNWNLMKSMIPFILGDNSRSGKDSVCIVNRIPDDIQLIASETGDFAGTIDSRAALRYAIRHYKEKKFYFFAADHHPDPGLEASPVLRFMHRECRILQTPVIIAQRLSMAVVYCRMRIDGKGRYMIEFLPICEDASRKPVDDILKRYLTLLEEDLHAQPHNYLWTHAGFWQL